MHRLKKPSAFAGLAAAPAPEAGQTTDGGERDLMARGRDRGFVTSEEILGTIPDIDLTPEKIEEFLVGIEERLHREGVEVIEVPGEEADGQDSPRRPTKDRDFLKASTHDPVRMYLKEIGKVPLLTAAQEVDLAMRIEGAEMAAELLASVEASGNLQPDRFRRVVDAVVRIRRHQLDPERKLRREGIGRETARPGHRPRTRADAIVFLRRLVKDVEVARRKLIEANLRLVVSIAKRYAHRGMMFLDLTQEGNLGLMRAVEKFDYTKGYKFSTYATWWIRQAISRAVADQSRTIRIPVHMTEYINKVARSQGDLLQRLGRDPRPEEIGRHIGIAPEKVRQTLAMPRDPISLESPVGDGEDSSIGDFIQDVGAVVPLDAASFTLLQEHLERVLHTLDEREQGVIRLRFGLSGGEPRTLEEVGLAFGVTRERIRQIEAKTLCKLRHPSRAQQLKEYLD